MKKILTLIFLSVFCLNAINAYVLWELSDAGTLTISGTGMPDYSYDSSDHSYNFPWYNQRKKIKNIIIENGVKNIGQYAFLSCSNLVSITIPNSVTGIGESAFSRCSSLTSITIPNSVTVIGKSAFSDCSSLTSITSPNSVTGIGESAFSGCSSLTSITIPNNVTVIGKSAFWGCSSLTSITIPNSVADIGESAFRGCSSLTSITIPESVNIIGSGAFFDCNNLTNLVYNAKNATLSQIGNYSTNSFPTSVKSVTIGEEVESIPLYFLVKNKNITSVTIPNNVTSIGSYAFYQCSGLTSVTISNSVTSIGMYAFSNCSGLTSITIPNSVTIIFERAFKGCSSLTTLAIPNSVTEIGRNAFEGCSGLTSITLPNSLTTIGMETFSGCSGLTSITIPNSVTSIEISAFENCYNLTSITIPNSVKSIGSCAFKGCSGLTSIKIPNSMTKLGGSTFEDCNRLGSIICEATTPPDCSSRCFYNVKKSIPVCVPVGSVEEYKAANGWKEFTNIIDNQFIADAVIAKINAIGEVEISFLCEDKIDKAIAAYDALTDAQKALVSNFDILTMAIQTYEALMAAAETIAADEAVANPVIAKIKAIGKVEYTDACKSKIDAASKAYEALTDDQKALVTNIDVLTTAKQTYETLKAAAEKLAADKAKADPVIAKINAIGKVEYTDACKNKIDAANTAYNALTADQKTLVTNLDVLTTAQQTYDNLKAAAEKLAADKAKADPVIAKINAIGKVEYTYACKDKIDEANNAYNALTADQKALVTNIDVLTTAKQTYDNLKAAAEKLAADKAAFDKYKSEIVAIIEALVKDDDSDAVKEIIRKAISDIESLEYEEAISIDDNKAKVQSLVTSVNEAVENQRAEDQKTNGIEELEFADKYNIYDLNGRKITNSMLKSGLYIRNGKKVVVK